MINKRELFIKEILANGRNLTWTQYAEKYRFRDDKQANDYWRYYEKTGKYCPDCEATGCSKVCVVDGQAQLVEPELPEGFKIKKVWGKPGNLSYSAVEDSQELSSDDKRQLLMEDIVQFSPQIEKIKRDENAKGIFYEISIPDLHFGKEDIQITSLNFKKAVYDLVRRVQHMNIKRFILPIGNDIMNSEGLKRATTKGTPQFDFADWRETFRAAWMAAAEVILSLTDIAPVDVIIIQGNHDFERSFYLGDVLAAYFHKNENVTVDNSFDTRKYYAFGNVLLGYDHGELKANEYPLLMATERPQAFANARHHEWHLGHMHKEMALDEIRGIKVRFLPSICANDAWHKSKGYESKRKAQAYMWDELEGLLGYQEVGVWKA